MSQIFYMRERLVSRRTGTISQIRAFLLERGVAVRQGLRFLRADLQNIFHFCRPNRARSQAETHLSHCADFRDLF